MRVILRSDVANVGHKGDVVEVTNGYARNFLLPRGLAMAATAGGEAQAEGMRRSRSVKDAADRGAAEEVATKLVPTTITIATRVSGEGKLFGSIHAHEIVAAIAEQTGIEIDRKKVRLDEPIKTSGTHLVPVKLHTDVEFPVTLEIVSA